MKEQSNFLQYQRSTERDSDVYQQKKQKHCEEVENKTTSIQNYNQFSADVTICSPSSSS